MYRGGNGGCLFEKDRSLFGQQKGVFSVASLGAYTYNSKTIISLTCF